MGSASAPSTSSLRRLFDRAFDEDRPPGVEGAVLLSRHGVPLAGRAAGIDDLASFAAMHATALGAAEIAFTALGSNAAVTLIAETDGKRFVSRALDGSMLAVALVGPEADHPAVLAWMARLPRRLSGSA